MFSNPDGTPIPHLSQNESPDQPSSESIFNLPQDMDPQKLMAIETAVNAIRELHSLNPEPTLYPVENPVKPEYPGHLSLLERALEEQRRLNEMN